MKAILPLALVLLAAPLPAAEVFEAALGREKELPGGKEADGIRGDFILRSDKVEAVVSQNAPLRRANMSTFYGEDGVTPGCLFDLTLRGTNNDQLICYGPAGHGPVSYVKTLETKEAGSAAVEAMTAALREGDTTRVEAAFTALTNISIDYALMEKAHNIVMARGDFEWEDIGSWEAVGRIFPHDEQGNVVTGDAVLIDTQNSIVFRTTAASEVAVAALGVENLVIVVTGDAVLVMPRDRAQDVRKVVEELHNRGSERL